MSTELTVDYSTTHSGYFIRINGESERFCLTPWGTRIALRRLKRKLAALEALNAEAAK